MHLEILVEDLSGKALLDLILPRLVSPGNTFKVISYKGIGKLPKDLQTTQDPSKRILLEQLPRLIRGYGRSYRDYEAVLIIVVDCDRRVCADFKKELVGLLDQCNPRPTTYFRIAIEEMEAWLLGDRAALRKAYPALKEKELGTYTQDGIVGTWEKLADVVFPGGSAELKKAPFYEIGKQKSVWAATIGQYLDLAANQSPSFNCLLSLIKKFKTDSGDKPLHSST
jgi:hypothetical protein